MTTIKLTMKSQVYVPPSTELKILEEIALLESPHYRAMYPAEVCFETGGVSLLNSQKCKRKELILLHLFRGCKNEVTLSNWMGFPDSFIGKESACNGGNSGSIPGSGRSTGEGIGYSLQYSWASFVAQLVKNLPAMQETWVQSPGWKDPLEKGKATHSSILGLPWQLSW